jgi:hypothetical protein
LLSKVGCDARSSLLKILPLAVGEFMWVVASCVLFG